MKTLHFIYTVPRGGVVSRAWNKVASTGLVPPLHRSGHDALISWKHPIRAPHSISYNLLHALKGEYRVKFYSIYEHGVCATAPGDIVLAQPAPLLPHVPPREMDRESMTYRTFYECSDVTKIIIMPYSHDAAYTAWWSDLVRDHGRNCIFISGKIWFDTWERSPFRDFDIRNKMRMDVGLAMSDYPQTKRTFNPKGTRGILYIGHTGWYKNTKELERIARASDMRFGHIGRGHIEGWKKISDFAQLSPAYLEHLAKDYDMLINVSNGDPQVTTVLEMMSSGFLVAATPESGHDHGSIFSLRTSDTAFNRGQLEAMQQLSDEEIKQHVEENRRAVSVYHSWERITREVLTFVASV